jgi:transcription factor E
MQTKLLHDIVEEIGGKEASNVLDILMGKKDVNEFLVAKKLKLTINQVRNILYKLANFSLVSFTRKKDKRKGWYTYFWTLETEKALNLLEKRLKKEIISLQQQLKSRKEKRFYICKTCKTEVSEETALLHDFTCLECGEVYELADNKKISDNLKSRIGKLKRQRQSVLAELEKIGELKARKRIREEKKLAKKKKEERKLKKLKKKKSGKKPVKKKVKKK